MAIIEKLKKNIKKHFFPGRETNPGRWSGSQRSTNFESVVFSRQTQMALMSQQDFLKCNLAWFLYIKQFARPQISVNLCRFLVKFI